MTTVLADLPPRPAPPQMVGREGFEPSKPEGRQIYSLMRLAASLPPRRRLTRPRDPRRQAFPALRGWSWRRELNPRPADYKSAALPLSYASDKPRLYQRLTDALQGVMPGKYSTGAGGGGAGGPCARRRRPGRAPPAGPRERPVRRPAAAVGRGIGTGLSAPAAGGRPAPAAPALAAACASAWAGSRWRAFGRRRRRLLATAAPARRAVPRSLIARPGPRGGRCRPCGRSRSRPVRRPERTALQHRAVPPPRPRPPRRAG